MPGKVIMPLSLVSAAPLRSCAVLVEVPSPMHTPADPRVGGDAAARRTRTAQHRRVRNAARVALCEHTRALLYYGTTGDGSRALASSQATYLRRQATANNHYLTHSLISLLWGSLDVILRSASISRERFLWSGRPSSPMDASVTLNHDAGSQRTSTPLM